MSPRGEPALQGLDGQRDLPSGEHYGDGGDTFLVDLVVGGLVIFSSTW
jgi:hypothetical protein